jgi:uncharacterized protein involved in exopolysaccharide biosynthesis
MAEDHLQEFLQRNRDFRGAPQLAFEYDRLQRDVAMRQAVYTNLMQALEQSKIEEVRNTPVISMVERPILPAKPDSRLIALKALIAVLAGGLIGLAAALSIDFLSSGSQVPLDDRKYLVQLGREAWADFRRPWKLFR